MKVLVINAGSSSLKYQLIDMSNESVLAKGNCERIGIEGSVIGHKTADGYKVDVEGSLPTHAEAFAGVMKLLSTGEHAVIKDLSEIGAVGHRLVQGGEKFTASALITDEMLKAAEELSDLAPLHNPPNIMAIRACQKVLDKSVPQVAVFDTAFHQTMPEKAYIYALPYEYYEKYGIRRYGYHGTSHRFVSARLAKVMGKPLSELKIISCHLGNGSSIAAIDGGKSVDTTMGLTPLEGLTMGTRCGAIDPAIVTYIQDKEGLDAQGINDVMNKKSGYLGVSGLTSDQRDLMEAAEQGNHRAQLALDIQIYQIKKYIGSFAAAMGGVDAITFTGGIGENSDLTREGACEGLEFMGVNFDKAANKGCREEAMISTADSKVKVYIIPTNEELMIAQDTLAIVEGRKPE